MSGTESISIDIFAILVLLLLLWTSQRRLGSASEDQRVFSSLMTVNILLLVFDALNHAFGGRTFHGATFLMYFLSCASLLLAPLAGYLYARFCEIKIELSADRRRKHAYIFAVSVAIHWLLVFLSLWSPVLFDIVGNLRIKGPLYPLSFVFSGFPAVFAFVEIIISRHRLSESVQRVENVLLVYFVPPAIGAVVQVLYTDTTIIWVSTMFSHLILFVNLQNSQITTDALSGLNNRGRLHSYLQWKTRRLKEGSNLYLIMLDIDNFKQVNDKYGHLAGDYALRAAADCLRAGASCGDFIARYGGDEFVILAERGSDAEIAELMDAVRRAASDRKVSEKLPYELMFSMGFARWMADDADLDEFVARADSNMYEQKKDSRRTLPDKG